MILSTDAFLARRQARLVRRGLLLITATITITALLVITSTRHNLSLPVQHGRQGQHPHEPCLVVVMHGSMEGADLRLRVEVDFDEEGVEIVRE
ncbi:hypothetical protein BCR35DRAFT_308978 [Leucosporidium creatinivorum]|uniref:Uncharacterized protein n=1 Tax=Leucosporidium creatinivorum TaxID=106004 RepID=A0A1Y2DU15_9BASI|nr:hypothetical protein BCR35DRAFT_308978 [Leucosporidium creatinivorum]